ncbi:electron transfer flavoprotein subunit alpha/FixB family protein [Azorhizobium doebereinerae]|uniref:electron transfer flavoprotein subunit alpha/FixB family protein n=1 Tax=Azorhizobium doebereinerae TaxID=281091 RepID=UPI0003FC2911|nr:electron transfer flavoprotein subunit alpha/FixB family protein [Azorhizobium doebereinerae]
MSRPRRDPRAERAARLVPSKGRPRLALGLAGGSVRPRRDPRAERIALEVEGAARRRFDLAATGQGPVAAVATPRPDVPAAGAAPELRLIPNPAFLVFAVADASDGHLTVQDRQVLGAARGLADAGGGAVVLLSPSLPEEAGAAGADRSARLAVADDADVRADALVAAITTLGPRHVLWPESRAGGDLARRVAVRLGEDLFCGAEQVSASIVSRPAKGGRVEQRRAPPRLVTLADGAAAPHRRTRHEARVLDLPASAPPTDGSAILSVEDIPADPSTVALAEADFVVSAGHGVTDFAGFGALARALGATPGASRMVCDAGLMPRAAQVGASGTVLAARCYFALGIAGAPQHLQGVAACEYVVAVNTDLHAAMVERAGLAIVADAQEVMPALIAALAEEGA